VRGPVWAANPQSDTDPIVRTAADLFPILLFTADSVVRDTAAAQNKWFLSPAFFSYPSPLSLRIVIAFMTIECHRCGSVPRNRHAKQPGTRSRNEMLLNLPSVFREPFTLRLLFPAAWPPCRFRSSLCWRYCSSPFDRTGHLRQAKTRNPSVSCFQQKPEHLLPSFCLFHPAPIPPRLAFTRDPKRGPCYAASPVPAPARMALMIALSIHSRSRPLNTFGPLDIQSASAPSVIREICRPALLYQIIALVASSSRHRARISCDGRNGNFGNSPTRCAALFISH